MKGFHQIISREINLLFYNRSMFVFAVVLPFISILFFNFLLSNPVARDLPVAVVDLDQTSISRELTSQLNATPELNVSYFPLDQKSGEQLIRELKVYGLITIPKNFGSDLKQGRQTQIVNQYNSLLLLPSGLENKAVLKTVGTISAGINIQKQMASGVNVKQALVNFQPVQSSNHSLSNPFGNYSYYLNSGFLTMFFQMFVMLTTIYCFGTDFKYKKGKKLFALGQENTITIVLAKLLPYALWFFFVGMIMYYSMYVFQDFPMNGSKSMLIIGLVLLIFSTQAYAVFIISLSRSFRESLTYGSSFAAVSLSFSGITFPIEGMPKVLQGVSQIFPYTHYFQLLTEQAQRGIPISYSINKIAILIICSIVVLALSYKNIRKLLMAGAFKNNI